MYSGEKQVKLTVVFNNLRRRLVWILKSEIHYDARCENVLVKFEVAKIVINHKLIGRPSLIRSEDLFQLDVKKRKLNKNQISL